MLMLMQFTVQNFLSFDAEQTLSMLASPDVAPALHPSHLLGEAPPLVRAAALYGANAAGKSNLIKAISWARKLILDGTRAGRSIPVTPFKLRPDAAQEPSRFGFVVRYKGAQYEYGFAVDRQRVREEWLFVTPEGGGSEERVFERVTNDDGAVEVEFGTFLTGGSAEQAQFWQFLAKGTRPNQLLLTEARERNQSEHLPIIEWFTSCIYIIEAEYQIDVWEDFVPRRGLHKELLASFLKRAETGIDSIDFTLVPFEIGNTPWSDYFKIVVHDFLMQSPPNRDWQFPDLSDKPIFLQRNENNDVFQVKVRSSYSSQEGIEVYFDITEESDGTQRLIGLVPQLALLQDDNNVVLIDEIDRRLHPKLSEMLVQAALACPEGQAPPQSQLIFTTHETHLLDLDLLRPDEIWFAEKDRGGASHLYSLAEFPLRDGLQLEKGYLNGRFGAIPFVGDARQLLETTATLAKPDTNSTKA